MTGKNAAGGDRATLLAWMEQQYQFSAAAMLRALSATGLVKERRGFGQTIKPVRGSVLASLEIASYDPDPDYFFHWLRDSALVMDALRVLIADQTLGAEALEYFVDFIQFSLALCRLDGRLLLERADFRRAIDPACRVYVRSDAELADIVGDHVLGEARVNPDGTLDIIKWARPQHDGPALRALTLLRFWRLDPLRTDACHAPTKALLENDLDFTLRHWQEPCFDLWEETYGHHYHTRLVQCAALNEGAARMQALGDLTRAQAYRVAAEEIAQCLDAHFDLEEGVYLSHATASEVAKLDIAVILGVIHAARSEGAHGIVDPKVLATLARLEAQFATEYQINRERAPHCAPAMGRYRGDSYYSGGAYYFSTLAAAQFYFRFAEAVGRGARIPVSGENRSLLAGILAEAPQALQADAIEPRFRRRLFKELLNRGDMFMAMVREHTPATRELSEQFDQSSGAQTSAKNLTWSYAAFVTAFASRKATCRLIGH
jgi:glucoamylase